MYLLQLAPARAIIMTMDFGIVDAAQMEVHTGYMLYRALVTTWVRVPHSRYWYSACTL